MNTPMPAREAVARAVRGALAERRITQVDLSLSTDISRASLAKKLAGTTAFTIDELELIGRTIGVPMTDLIQKAEQLLAGAA